MRLAKLLLMLAVIVCPAILRAQTATLRYSPPASAACGGGTACAVSLAGKPIIAGDALVYQCSTQIGAIASVTNGGVFTRTPVSFIRDAGGQSNSGSQGYILSAAAESGTDTITFSLPTTISTNSYGYCTIKEYQATGGTLVFDGDNGITSASGTSIVSPAFTPSTGASDVSLQEIVGLGGSANSISPPFSITNTLTAVWATANPVTTTQSPTWTFPGSVTDIVAQELQLGFGGTSCTDWTFNNFSGTNGTVVNTANLSANSFGFQGGGWSTSGGAMNFSNVYSAPLVGTLSRSCAGTNISNGGGDTTALDYPTASGLGTHVNFGNESTGILTLGQMVAEVNQSFDIPDSQAMAIDSFGIRAAQSANFVNAMLMSNNGLRSMVLECGNQNNVGFFRQLQNTTLHLQVIFNPNFRHFLNVYSGWQNPTNQGQLLYSMSCPSTGTNDFAASVWLGNIQGQNPPPAGFHVYYDSLLVTYNPIPALPTCYAASAAEADVQTAITQCGSKGTIIVPASRGVAVSWVSKLAITATGPLTIQGQTLCTAGCAPGSEGVGLAFADDNGTCSTQGTCITLPVAGGNISFGGCNSTNLCKLQNFTFTNTANSSNQSATINFFGQHNTVSMRFNNNHVISNQGTTLGAYGSFGLVDHVLYDSNGSYAFAGLGGDFNTSGYLNWTEPTNPGSQEAYFFEDSKFNFAASPGQVHDGQYGCKATVRHNQITGPGSMSLTHGTDSGGFRSCIIVEDYNNTLVNNSANSGQTSQTRGGVVIVHDNSATGTKTWLGLDIQYYRALGQSNSPGWGTGLVGLDWSPLSTDPTNGNSSKMTLNAASWQATHAYAANASVASNVGVNFITLGSCTSGSSQPAWNTTFPQLSNGASLGSFTPVDGNCTWYNVAGSTTNNGNIAGFCAANPDTMASSDATCAALSTGDTASRHLDANGGNHPYRDQPCVGHNQVVMGCYQWNNTGTPSAWFGSDSGYAVQLNRDYFNSAPGPGLPLTSYASFGYPHFLQGSVATTAILSVTCPSTCTSLAFADTIVGNSTLSPTITLTNTGTVTLTGLNSSTWLSDLVNYQIVSNTCGASINAGASCTLAVSFRPQSAASFPATLTFISNAANSPTVVNLSGNGVSFQAATPTFSLPAGRYSTPQLVVISSTTAGATICYKIDGTAPTANGAGICTSGTTLANGGTIIVAFTQLVRAIASKSGFTDSAVASAQYTLPTASTGMMVAGNSIIEGTVQAQ